MNLRILDQEVSKISYSILKIPEKIQQLLRQNNIKSFKPIQQAAVQQGLFDPLNMLVSAPSGSGKTLIGQLAIVYQLYKNLGTALFIVPYRALAHEKLQTFTKFFGSLKLTVQALTGDTPTEEKETINGDIIITTYEKCDALLRQKNPIFFKLRCIVFDEIHEIGSAGRGARIEVLLMRLILNYPDPQYLFFSATIGNVDEFCSWLNQLDSKVIQVKSDFRPVKLNYVIELYSNQLSTLRALLKPRLEINQQILIFVNQRKTSVKLAQDLSKTVSKFLNEMDHEKLLQGKRALIRVKSYAQPLKEVITSGIAYHNASLRASDRSIIEKLFIDRHIKVLVATTTLAAGINTPAHTVIITDIIQARKIRDYTEAELHDPTTVIFPNKKGIYKPFSSNQLFQMLGRAGRMGFTEHGKENEGEGILLVRDKDEMEYARLNYFMFQLNNENNLIPRYESLCSHLYKKDHIEELVLQLVGDNEPCTIDQICTFIQKSWYWFLLQNHTNTKKLKPDLDMADIFQLKSLSFLMLLKHYTWPPHSNPQWQPKKIEIKEQNAYQISFTVEYPKMKYHGIMTDRKGFWCSCTKPMRLSLFKPVHSQYKPFFCQHHSDFLRWVAREGSESQKELVLRIITRTTKYYNVITNLLRSHFLAQHPWQDVYNLAALGNLAQKLYLFPSELLWIMQAVKAYGFSTVEFQLRKCVQFYCLRNKKDQDTVISLLAGYIDEMTVEYLKQRFPKIGAGDIFSLVGEISRIAGIIQRVALYEGKIETARKFEMLGYRLKHGVKSELIDLMESFPNMSRNKARILYDSGITSARMVSETGIHELKAKTGLELTQLVDLKNPKKIGPIQTTIHEYLRK